MNFNRLHWVKNLFKCILFYLFIHFFSWYVPYCTFCWCFCTIFIHKYTCHGMTKTWIWPSMTGLCHREENYSNTKTDSGTKKTEMSKQIRLLDRFLYRSRTVDFRQSSSIVSALWKNLVMVSVNKRNDYSKKNTVNTNKTTIYMSAVCCGLAGEYSGTFAAITHISVKSY